MVPTLWSARKWDEETSKNLQEYLKKNPGDYILKPSHLSLSNNIILITEYNTKNDWESIVNKIDKIPMDKESVEKWKKENNMEYCKLNPGLMLQNKFDITNQFREIKFNVVLGKVVNFKWWNSKDKIHVQLEVNEEDNSRFCLYWPDMDRNLNTEKCDELEKMMNWDVVIPKIEKFASKLHLDFVRIDIFPLDKGIKFYVNEIELESGFWGNFQDTPMKKLKSFSNFLKKSKNKEKFFVSPNYHDLGCTIFDTPSVWN